MNHLHQHLSASVDEWRSAGYPCDGVGAIGEILEWSRDPDTGSPRFLRKPQLHALETYWYLRLVEQTPHVLDLYRKRFSKQSQLLEALGLGHGEVQAYVLDHGLDELLDRVRTDDDFVRDFRLDSLRETLTLDYPSYILALAMGAGKTALIGAIIASEFAMAMEYPDGLFVRNALFFIPGTTALPEIMRELASMPYDRVLPSRLFKPFAASVKLTFTRDAEKDIPVIHGSSYNVVVTNSEKIRIQKETIRKSDIGGLFGQAEEEAKAEVANLRLQSIASLPHLAVFSDEAHHTYGQSLGADLKKVRKTVDYLAGATNVICVVNTTGTPYYRRQPLKDVVFWYGLSQGIRDGYLKDLAGNIQSYAFDGETRRYIAHVVEDFFRDYGEVRLPNGAKAKLAIYFPQTDDLRELRPVIDQALVAAGQSPALALVNTSDASLTTTADIDAFNRLNDPSAPHRVVLLVNKGTEGWNCPSLFACALARKLRTSNNFVLQATTRCLRQVPGNAVKARVYLSTENFKILDRQLQETYGETISELNRAGQETGRAKLVLRKLDVPPIVVTQVVRTVTRREDAQMRPLRLTRPKADRRGAIQRRRYTLAVQQATPGVLRDLGESVEIDAPIDAADVYAAAVELSGNYRLRFWLVYDELRRIYGRHDVPLSDFDDLAEQIENQTRAYEVREERVDVALALVKPAGFEKEAATDGMEIYTAEIVYPKDREHLLLRWEQLRAENTRDFAFHYSPYDFDSSPEKSFFEQVLAHLNLHPGEVEDFYFTGAMTDTAKTDFFVEYRDDQGRPRRYSPDFVIRKKPGHGQKRGTGKVFIIEIKSAEVQSVIENELVTGTAISIEGRKAMAVRRWEALNPDRLQYQIIFAPAATVPTERLATVRGFIEERSP